MWASEQEALDHWREGLCDHKPAEPGDTRFEFFDSPNEDTPYGCFMVDDKGVAYETHFFETAWDRSSLVESFRYHQAVPFEVEFAPFGPAWQREQEERGVFA